MISAGSPIIAVIICAGVAIFARTLGERLDVMDRPDGFRKLHRRPVPMVGGLAIFFSTLVAFALIVLAESEYASVQVVSLIGASIFFVIGFLDDRDHVQPWPRLIIFALTVFLVSLIEPLNALHFINSHELSFRFGLAGAAIPVTIFVLLCFQNAANMADGTDGLLISLSLVWLAVLWPWAPDAYKQLILIMAAGLAVLLIANLKSALFMGDAGSYFLSVFIGFLAIQIFNLQAGALPADYLGAAFMLPVIDMGRLLFERAWKRRNPFEPDRRHFHHILLDLTGSNTATVMVYCGMAGSPLLTLLYPALSIYAVIVGQFAVYGVALYFGSRRVKVKDTRVSTPFRADSPE